MIEDFGLKVALAAGDIVIFFFVYRWLFNNVKWFRDQIR